MKYYEYLINRTERDWPFMPATAADDEIARLKMELGDAMLMVAVLQQVIKEKDEIIKAMIRRVCG